MPVNVPQPLYCPTPIEGPPEADVKLHCLTQADVPARKIVAVLPAGRRRALHRRHHEPHARRAGSAPSSRRSQVTGRALQFYFEARGESNRVAAANGKDDLPNVIVLKPGRRRRWASGALAALHLRRRPAPTGEEETPLQVRETQEERAAEVEAPRPPGARASSGSGLGVGIGLGLAPAAGRWSAHRSRQVTTGFSPAGLGHATPGAGLPADPAPGRCRCRAATSTSPPAARATRGGPLAPADRPRRPAARAVRAGRAGRSAGPGHAPPAATARPCA